MALRDQHTCTFLVLSISTLPGIVLLAPTQIPVHKGNRIPSMGHCRSPNAESSKRTKLKHKFIEWLGWKVLPSYYKGPYLLSNFP